MFKLNFFIFRIDLSKLYKIDKDILAKTRDLKVTCSYTVSSSVFEFAPVNYHKSLQMVKGRTLKGSRINNAAKARQKRHQIRPGVCS